MISALGSHSLTSSYTARRDERLGEQWLEVWHQKSSYVNHGGFPRTWYSGNHCHGRASYLGTGAHILATGIPEVHRHLISSSIRATPMHPCCPLLVASEWLDPRLMVSLFWVIVGHILAGCKCPLGKFREVTYCGCLIAWLYVLLSVLTGWGACFAAFHHVKATNGLWCHTSSIWGCPRHPAAFCLSQIEIQQ